MSRVDVRPGVEVFLDGRPLADAVWYDVEAGLAGVRSVHWRTGEPVLGPDGRPEVVEVCGRVTTREQAPYSAPSAPPCPFCGGGCTGGCGVCCALAASDSLARQQDALFAQELARRANDGLPGELCAGSPPGGGSSMVPSPVERHLPALIASEQVDVGSIVRVEVVDPCRYLVGVPAERLYLLEALREAVTRYVAQVPFPLLAGSSHLTWEEVRGLVAALARQPPLEARALTFDEVTQNGTLYPSPGGERG